MKRMISGLVALAFVAALPAAGLAQDKREAKDRPTWSNTQGLHDPRDLSGAKIQRSDGQELGELDALLMDPKDGKITHAVVAYGGKLGMGDQKVVVPYSALKMTGHEDGKKAKIVMDQAVLDKAPKYVKTKDRAPSASPATAPRSDARPDAKQPAKGHDADGRTLSDDPKAAKNEKVGATQSDAKKPDAKY